MPKARIIFRSSIGYRVLLSVGLAKDGSIYISHGYQHKHSKIYASDIVLEEGVKSKDCNFRDHLKLELPPNFKGHHTGLKASGIILDKYDYENDKQYNRFLINGLLELKKPILVEQIIPGRLEKFKEKISDRKLDYVIPNEPDTIEELTNGNGFRFELWLRNNGKQSTSPFLQPNALVAVDMILDTKILTLFLIQDETDIKRGLLDRLSILRSTTNETKG